MKSSGGRVQSLSAENLSDEFNVYRLQDNAKITSSTDITKYPALNIANFVIVKHIVGIDACVRVR